MADRSFLKYLKEAFYFRTNLPPFGSLPVNILALLGFVMLGFGHPGFWLIGLGAETAWLYGASTSQRFRRIVDAEGAVESEKSFVEHWRSLVHQLSPDKRQRLNEIEQKCELIISKYQEAKADEFFLETNRDALRQLVWLYLKMMIARTNLEKLDHSGGESGIRRKIESLGRDIKNESMSDPIRASKMATLEILRKRLENWERRETFLTEIDSDIHRIEEHIDLAVENATMAGSPQAVSSNIDLYSKLLDEGIYGDSARTVAELDQSLHIKE
jgi:hypothetical protein